MGCRRFSREKLREQRYDISEEELSDYFPIDKVLNGLICHCCSKLYGIEITELSDFDVSWHPDVRRFEITEDGNHVGRFFFDLYARSHKRGGACDGWCTGEIPQFQWHANQSNRLSVCNFTPASQGKPALLTNDEVTTLFHEFGHGLHHMLTRIEFAGASGINGVAWDAVELPSQFMENWCWEARRLSADLWAL